MNFSDVLDFFIRLIKVIVMMALILVMVNETQVFLQKVCHLDPVIAVFGSLPVSFLGVWLMFKVL